MFFKKLKMKAKELQAENEQLKAHIALLASQLYRAESDLIEHKKGLDFYKQRNEALLVEMNHINMKVNTANANQNDSRYY
jgi:hypothetical protein